MQRNWGGFPKTNLLLKPTCDLKLEKSRNVRLNPFLDLSCFFRNWPSGETTVKSTDPIAFLFCLGHSDHWLCRAARHARAVKLCRHTQVQVLLSYNSRFHPTCFSSCAALPTASIPSSSWGCLMIRLQWCFCMSQSISFYMTAGNLAVCSTGNSQWRGGGVLAEDRFFEKYLIWTYV